MSRYLSKRYEDFQAYEAGEQPKNSDGIVKLNTNESPFPPSPKMAEALKEFDAASLRLYSDPLCTGLREKLAAGYGLSPGNFMPANGSDDILNYFFMAYGDPGSSDDPENADPSFVFPDITYSFYEVLCGLHGYSFRTVPLTGSMTIDPDDYRDAGASIAIANPNAPTGISLELPEIGRILASNRDHAVLIDEAYVDFGAETAMPLINKYDNLIVSRTFSKSGSFAGGRLGFAAASEPLIRDLEKIRQSQSPYNVDSVTQKLGEAALSDDEYYRNNTETIKENRHYLRGELAGMGFRGLPSHANFLFVNHPDIAGKDLYLELKSRGILVRHFDRDRIRGYVRITIGTKEQMDLLISEIRSILGKE